MATFAAAWFEAVSRYEVGWPWGVPTLGSDLRAQELLMEGLEDPGETGHSRNGCSPLCMYHNPANTRKQACTQNPKINLWRRQGQGWSQGWGQGAAPLSAGPYLFLQSFKPYSHFWVVLCPYSDQTFKPQISQEDSVILLLYLLALWLSASFLTALCLSFLIRKIEPIILTS